MLLLILSIDVKLMINEKQSSYRINISDTLAVNFSSNLEQNEIETVIDQYKDRIFNESSSILNKDKDYKFTGNISIESQNSITQIICNIFLENHKKNDIFSENISILNNISFERKSPTGLSHFNEIAFSLEGEPNEKMADYLKPGELINPGLPDEFIFVRSKRFGVEPGYEKIFLRELLPDGKVYGQALEVYDHSDNKENYSSYNYWIADQQNRQKVIERLIENPEILNTILYFDKLDYRKEVGSNIVKVPSHRSQNWIHQQNTKDTIEGKNNGALMEVLANDVYRALGMPSQQAYLIRSKYPTGEDKFLISSKCVTGTKGELFNTFDGNIHYGQLVGNKLVARDDKGIFRIYQLDKEQLSLANASQRLLADRDGVGSTGSNIGFYQDAETKKIQIVNIDPGKSLEGPPTLSFEGLQDHLVSTQGSFTRFFKKLFFGFATFLIGQTDRMKDKDLNTDCTYSPSRRTLRDIFQKGYANFTALEDVTLAENIKCMNRLIIHQVDVNQVFDDYKEKFKGTPYLESIENGKERFNARLEYFKIVLKDRLRLSEEALTVIENLEKLTSMTTNFAGNKKTWSALQHLRILPKHRKEWNITKDSLGDYEVWFEAKSKSERGKVIQRLEAFNPNLNVEKNGCRLTIRIQKNQLSAFLNELSEEAIAKHKNQFLFPDNGLFALMDKEYNLHKYRDIILLSDKLKDRSIPLQKRDELDVCLKSAIKLLKLRFKARIKSNKEVIKKLENTKNKDLNQKIDDFAKIAALTKENAVLEEKLNNLIKQYSRIR